MGSQTSELSIASEPRRRLMVDDERQLAPFDVQPFEPVALEHPELRQLPDEGRRRDADPKPEQTVDRLLCRAPPDEKDAGRGNGERRDQFALDRAPQSQPGPDGTSADVTRVAAEKQPRRHDEE